MAADPLWERFEDGAGRVGLRLAGRLDLDQAPRLHLHLAELLARPGARAYVVDLAGVERLTGACAALLVDAEARACGLQRPLDFRGAREGVQQILELHRVENPCSILRPPPRRLTIFEQVGDATAEVLAATRHALGFLGEVALAAGRALRRPATLNWRGLLLETERAGADGLPIVALILFLVGLVTSFQAGVQLHKFGADNYIAAMVGISVTRELGPFMAAVVLAGRSGAAFAAELGSMTVSEEIDALRTLGLCPYRHLVLPRILAMAMVLPLLTILADAVGIAGGMASARVQLDTTWLGFLAALRESVALADVVGGLVKAVAFGTVIGLVGCERGLGARGGAAGVGRSTTSAVVAILFWLVVTDALFTLLYDLFGV